MDSTFALCVLSVNTGFLNCLFIIQKTFGKKFMCIISSQIGNMPSI